MSPQRFNRILLLLVTVFIFFSIAAYAASGPAAAVDASAHKGLCPRLEDTELLWEMLVRKAVSAAVCR